MGFDAPIESAINRLYDTLKLLHETIQTQIEATYKQSRIMIRLTRYLLGFTIALFVVAFFQIIIFIQERDTTTYGVQTQNYRKQIYTDNKSNPVAPTLPRIIK